MTFIDDIRATKAKLATAEAAAAAEQAAAVAQIRDVLFARLRPVAALSFATDIVLTEGCLAFAVSIIHNASEPGP